MGSIPDIHGKEFVEHYAEYLWEVYQRKIVHMPWGFCSYDIHDKYIFIADVYVEPRARGKGIPRKLLSEMEKVGQAVGRFYLGTKIQTLDKSWQNNLAICEHLGFGRAKVTSEYIFLMKRSEY